MLDTARGRAGRGIWRIWWSRNHGGVEVLGTIVPSGDEASMGRRRDAFGQVLDWNEPALRFYAKHGAALDDAWLNGRLTRLEMANTLNSSTS